MHKKQISKRRWKARIKAGRWVPMQVVVALDPAKDLSTNWVEHDIYRDFLRLRGGRGGRGGGPKSTG